MNTFLEWFAKIWLGLVLLLNLLGIVGTAISTQSFWETVSYIQYTYSPFNIINYLLILALVSPALGALYWLDKRRKSIKDNE